MNQNKRVRPDEIRKVHPSFAGYICPIQSYDPGEKVGMTKQVAFSAGCSTRVPREKIEKS